MHFSLAICPRHATHVSVISIGGNRALQRGGGEHDRLRHSSGGRRTRHSGGGGGDGRQQRQPPPPPPCVPWGELPRRPAEEDERQYQLHYHDAGSVPARRPNGRNGRLWEDDSSLATPTPVQQLSEVSDSNHYPIF